MSAITSATQAQTHQLATERDQAKPLSTLPEDKEWPVSPQLATMHNEHAINKHNALATEPHQPKPFSALPEEKDWPMSPQRAMSNDYAITGK